MAVKKKATAKKKTTAKVARKPTTKSETLNYIAENYYNNANLDQVVFWQKPEAGDYLKEKVFATGKKLPWNEMIKDATGESLNARFFIKQYVVTMQIFILSNMACKNFKYNLVERIFNENIFIYITFFYFTFLRM